MIAREIVSRVRGELKIFSPDKFISDRLILSILIPINNKLLSQQVSQRKAWGVDSLYITLPCLEMEEVPIYTCCDTDSDCKISKSKKRLPPIIDSHNNLAIRRVAPIDNQSEGFKYMSSPSRYSNILRIYPKSKNRYFFMSDGYLYVTDSNIEAVNISFIPNSLVDPESFSCKGPQQCPKNPLDLELKTLPKIESDVIRLTTESLIRSFLQIPSEKTSGDKIEGN